MERKKHFTLFISLACGGLLVPAGVEFYVVREYLALFLGFCVLFSIFAIALILIFMLKEARQGARAWLDVHTHFAHFLQPARARIPYHDPHGVRH